MGALWEFSGSSLGALWELSGSSLGALWELSGSSSQLRVSFCKSFLHYAYKFLPSSSIFITFPALSSGVYMPVCASCRHSSSRCHMMFDSKLFMYALPHCGSLLFSLWLTSRTILVGFSPTSDSSVMLRMNAQWSPTLYPNGMIQALLISRSLDAQSPSIWFWSSEESCTSSCASML